MVRKLAATAGNWELKPGEREYIHLSPNTENGWGWGAGVGVGERVNHQEEPKPELAPLWSGTRGRDTQGRFIVLPIRSSIQFDLLQV